MISLSPLDEQRFGIKTARVKDVHQDQLKEIEAYCHANNVQLLIARCDAQEISTVHALEQAGALLMDTLVYFTCDLTKRIPASGSFEVFRIDAMQIADIAEVTAIAKEAFTDYAQGHYHNDPLLDGASCTDAYIDWAARACAAHSAQSPVLVAKDSGEVVGFLTLQPYDDHTAELVLSGVRKSHQRKGLYHLLIAAGVEYAAKQNKTRVITSTQLTNAAVQKVWVRLGFEPFKSVYTFHKWYS